MLKRRNVKKHMQTVVEIPEGHLYWLTAIVGAVSDAELESIKVDMNMSPEISDRFEDCVRVARQNIKTLATHIAVTPFEPVVFKAVP